MRVAVLQVDGKYPNLALMKLAAWHKSLGNSVTRYEPLFGPPDLLYASKVFTTTPGYGYWPDCETHRGGTGYDLDTELPPAAERMVPDYHLFGCTYAMGYTTRGCIRKCGFCVVPAKEGRFRVVCDLTAFWTGQKTVKLLDNNLTADPAHLELICRQSRELNVGLDVTGGFDARLIDDEIAVIMRRAKWANYPHVAWDEPNDETAVVRGIRALLKAGFPATHLRCYVLTNYNTAEVEDMYRLEVLRELGVRPFVMLYGTPTKRQRRIARWVNRVELWASCQTFEEVSP